VKTSPEQGTHEKCAGDSDRRVADAVKTHARDDREVHSRAEPNDGPGERPVRERSGASGPGVSKGKTNHCTSNQRESGGQVSEEHNQGQRRDHQARDRSNTSP
jgi:hypothetical protein